MKKAILGVLGIIGAAILAPAVATAADDWKFAVTPYLWAAGINGSATVGSHEADASKSFDEILEDLDFAFMLNLQARKGRFGLYTDVTYLGMSDTTPVTTPGGTTLIEATTSIDSWIVDFGGSWQAARWAGSGEGKSGFVDLMIGARYWSLDTELQTESPVFGGERSVDNGMGWFDPIVGFRFAAGLTPKLQLIGRADVGGFDIGDASKLTWSASACLGWRFSPLVSAWAGWKHLSVEREDDSENRVELTFSGPVLGVAFTF